MDAISVVLVALATWQIVELLHHSEIALPLRRWTTRNAQSGVLRSFTSKAIRCPFCLSHWVAGALVVTLLLAAELPATCWWAKYPIWLFAGVRLANLGNDLAYEWNRSPKLDEDEEDDITIDDEAEPGTYLRRQSGPSGPQSY